jgi:hypothetical protein
LEKIKNSLSWNEMNVEKLKMEMMFGFKVLGVFVSNYCHPSSPNWDIMVIYMCIN